MPTQNKAGAVSFSSNLKLSSFSSNLKSVLSEFFQQECNMS